MVIPREQVTPRYHGKKRMRSPAALAPTTQPPGREANQIRGPPAHESLLSIEDVCARTSLSRTEIYRRVKAGAFPSPIRLSPIPSTGRGGRVAWIDGEITAWICDQIRAARGTEPKAEHEATTTT
jgi:prophage regulatory protein